MITGDHMRMDPSRCMGWTLAMGLLMLGGCTPGQNDEVSKSSQTSAAVITDDLQTQQVATEAHAQVAAPEDAPDTDRTSASKDTPAPATPPAAPGEMAASTPVAPAKPEDTPTPSTPLAAPAKPDGNPDAPDPAPEKKSNDPKPAAGGDKPETPAAAKPEVLTHPKQNPTEPPGPPQKPELPARLEGKLHKPVVVMSEAHGKSCLVKVDDTFPDLTLPDLAGEERSLSSLYGQTLTVVVVWSRGQALGREQFRRLERETFQPFRAAGVNVVAINTGDAASAVKPLYEQAGATFPCLLDNDGTAMATLATGKLPRTYLLNRQGRVVWLDIEYSRGSRRELENALYYSLLE